MIRCEELQGSSGQFDLGPLTLSVNEPVVAVVGPNGSGKTTLIETILGWRRVAGECWFNQTRIDPAQVETFRRIVYIGDYFPNMFLHMRADKFLFFLANVRNKQFGASVSDQLERAFHYLELLDLPLHRSPVSTYSLGMRRKLQIVAGLMQEPSLLIIDEPQIGLDFRSSSALRGIMANLVSSSGAQVLMSNHDLDSVARSADRVIALDQGQVRRDITAASYSGEDLERELESAFDSSQ